MHPVTSSSFARSALLPLVGLFFIGCAAPTEDPLGHDSAAYSVGVFTTLPIEDPPVPTLTKAPTQAATTVDWSFMRMQRSSSIAGLLQAKRDGRVTAAALTGLGSAGLVASMWGTPAVKKARIGRYDVDYQTLPLDQVVDVAPTQVNLGEVAAFDTASSSVRVIVPKAGTVNFTFIQPTHGPTEGYAVRRITSYTGEWVDGHRKIDKVVDGSFGGASIDALAGQEMLVEFGYTAPDTVSGLVSGTMDITGTGFDVKVPVRSTVSYFGSFGVSAVPSDRAPNVLRSESRDLAVTVSNLSGTPRTVTLTPDVVPAGVHADGATTSLGAFETKTVNVHLLVDSDAPTTSHSDLTFTVDGAGPSRTMGLSLGVYEPIKEFKWSGVAGYVHITQYVDIKADGTWTWHADLDNKALAFDENYITGFWFAAEELPDGRDMPGHLGSNLSGGHTDKIDQQGMSEALRTHYFGAVNYGVLMYLDTNTDWNEVAKFTVSFVAGKSVEALSSDAGGAAAGG